MSAVTTGANKGLWSARLPDGAGVARPGPVHGAYPIKPLRVRSASPTRAWLHAWLTSPAAPTSRGDRRFLQEVRSERAQWRGLDEAQRRQTLQWLRLRLRTEGLEAGGVAQSFAILAEAVQAQHGFELHEAQLLAAWWMLGQRLVEMATGEGKSLTVMLAAATGALAGVPVHVLTANDYLARRDAQAHAPLYEAVGLHVGYVLSASNVPQRQQAYQADVVYVTAKEVAFDHLRDRAARQSGQEGAIVLRGLCMAIIDEADSILIDEACTPLILAQQGDVRVAQQRYRMALYLARQLSLTADFELRAGMQVWLTPEGEARLAELARDLTGAWCWRRFRNEQVVCALQALHTFRRDVHYLVRDGDIHIIDETTGRIAVGRAWSQGLHQMIALKEGLTPQPENETLTQTTFQSFFPRYLRLAGLSGTLMEEAHELLRVYGLPVCRVPLRQASRRVDLGVQILPTLAHKWHRVVARAQQLSAEGRAVLIGVDSVADADVLSQALQAGAVPHQVLTARDDGERGEAERHVVANAGQRGCVTVATHMAGRGTDVHLAPEVLARGGLHVINTHLNRSARIDRQLLGRCARQGQPGSCETLLCWEDTCWRTARQHLVWRALQGLARSGWGGQALNATLCTWAQRRMGEASRRQRWTMLVTEALMARQLALSGREDWD